MINSVFEIDILFISANFNQWDTYLKPINHRITPVDHPDILLEIVSHRQFSLIIYDNSLEKLTIQLIQNILHASILNRNIPLLFIGSIEAYQAQLPTSANLSTIIDILPTPIIAPIFQQKIELFCQHYQATRQQRRQLVKIRQQEAQIIRLEAQLERYKTYLDVQIKKRTVELENHNKMLRHTLTQQEVMASALHEAETRYREIFENATEGIFQTTPQGQYLRCNPALARIYGYESPESLMANLSDIEHQLYLDPIRRREFISALEHHDIVIDFESQIRRKDGTIIWIKENARVVRDETQAIVYYEGLVEDITARKEAEANLRHINQASDRFVPHRLLSLLNKESITDLELNDCVQRQLTIMFMDIRAFTTLSEQMNPAENFQFLNDFLSHMAPIIQQHQGFIDKYLGDGIMALFENGTDAVEACVNILHKLTVYNDQRTQQNLPSINIGIGLNTGDVMVGMVGYAKRLDGTVIGDAVNVAARIEQLTKTYQRPLLISESCRQSLSHPWQSLTRFVNTVQVKGKLQPTAIYEVKPSPDMSSSFKQPQQIFTNNHHQPYSHH